jgi:hypothetical protein
MIIHALRAAPQPAAGIHIRKNCSHLAKVVDLKFGNNHFFTAFDAVIW